MPLAASVTTSRNSCLPAMPTCTVCVPLRPVNVPLLYSCVPSAHTWNAIAGATEECAADDPDAARVLIDVLDELHAAGAISTAQPPGAELVAWASVHGLAILLAGPARVAAARPPPSVTVSHPSRLGAKPDHAPPHTVSMPPRPHSLAPLRISSGAKNHPRLAPGPNPDRKNPHSTYPPSQHRPCHCD